MSLKNRLQTDIKNALKARESERLATLRLLAAAIQQHEVDRRCDLADDDGTVLQIIERLIKQRRDAAKQFAAGGRADRAAAEQAEIDFLAVYLPAALSADEVEAEIKRAFSESGAQGMADMGKVMAILKPRLAQRADMAAVSATVRQRLARPAN